MEKNIESPFLGEINASDFLPGIYLVSVLNDNHEICSEKIIIQ